MSLLLELSMVTITCCHSGCGVTFAVSGTWVKARKADHSSFYCPNGHSQFWPNQSDEEVLRASLARERAAHDQTRADRDRVLRERAAAKGQVTKIKNRIHAGVCLHCNRTFENLARHMKTKHIGSESERG